MNDLDYFLPFSNLQDRVVKGETDFKDLGDVYTRVDATERLILFKYNPTCGFKNESEWTWLEHISRGLILDRHTGEIVARPFDKFFNANDGDIDRIDCAYEKADGSLLIGYVHPETGEFAFATNGSFESDQALAATKFWYDRGLDKFSFYPGYTPLLEWIEPSNRIVIDYGDWTGYILLAMRNIETGEYLDYRELQLWYDHSFGISPVMEELRLVERYDVNDVNELFRWCEQAESANDGEGFVVYDSAGKMFKIKSAVYLKVHKLVSSISEKNIWEAMCEGRDQEFRDNIPDEFVDEYDRIRDLIGMRVEDVINGIQMAYTEILEIVDEKYSDWGQKEFALEAKESKFSGYLFKIHRDGGHVTKSLFDRVLNDYMKMVKKWNWFNSIDNTTGALD